MSIIDDLLPYSFPRSLTSLTQFYSLCKEFAKRLPGNVTFLLDLLEVTLSYVRRRSVKFSSFISHTSIGGLVSWTFRNSRKKCCTFYDCEVLCCTMIVMSFRAKLIETTRDPFPRDLRLYEVNLSK